MKINFRPKYLKKANDNLDEHILHIYQDKRESYQQKIFKESIWQKILNFFRVL